MLTDTSKPGFLRVSTRELPEQDRVPVLREVFGRKVFNVEIEARSERPVETEATILPLPGLHALRCNNSTPSCWKRTPQTVKDGNDDIALLALLDGSIHRSQRDSDLEAHSGSACVILHGEPAAVQSDRYRYICAVVPRAALVPLVADVEEAATRLVPRGSVALRLLRSYVGSLFKTPAVADPKLCSLIATHVTDLVALAIGVNRDGHEIVSVRGVRAARLSAIKADFASNPSLNVTSLAARQRVTPRYVQMLFEAEGTTFSAYALEQRLATAYSMLADPRYSGWTISAVTYEAGFGDLSHFHRQFKRRYGASPSDVRRGRGGRWPSLKSFVSACLGLGAAAAEVAPSVW